MFEGMDAGAVLEAAGAAHRARTWAENDELILATVWADLHPGESIHRDELALRGGARGVRPGGEGTPEVNDLAVADFGCRVEKGPVAASRFVGAALDLRHRLPRLWAKITGYQLPGWQGVQIARRTHTLTLDQARWVDGQIAEYAGTVPWGKLEDRLDAAIMTVDRDRIEEQQAARKGNRGVWVTQTDDDGLKGLYSKNDPLAINQLNATVQRLADCLPTESGTADQRRADALALLAFPLRAVEVLARHHQPELFDADLATAVDEITAETGEPVEESEVHPSLRDRPNTAPDVESAIFDAAVERLVERLNPDRLAPPAELVVHVAAESLERGHGPCRVAELGPTLLATVKDWLGHRRVRVRPVIDLNNVPPPVDCYEIPQRHRRHVQLRHPGSVFPWSTATRSLDLDHHRRYRPIMNGGPPGQTSVEALIPLARLEHRLVTHGGWRRRQPEPGTMIFRSPHGYVYLTNHHGTHDLGNSTFAHTIWETAATAARTELPKAG